MTLYLKYRPQTIDDLDLESVRINLNNIIKSVNLPHAFLFSGPKGTGKTSAARILAKIINCNSPVKSKNSIEPCNTCSTCVSITKGNNLDVIELDAASNRGIDDIRNLKEAIYLAPVNSKKKVYIIDEAHMLTLEAANAFLKTLEEPPTHVVFILATTNPEKLPATVISRLTLVNFIKANNREIARQLERVAKGEKIKITPPAIQKIASNADGSFRDAVKILESLIFKTKDIKESDIEDNDFKINNFFEILEKKDPHKSLEFIEDLVKEGISVKIFSEKISSEIHQSLLGKFGIGEDKLKNFGTDDLMKLHKLILESKKISSPINQLPLEIAIIKFCIPAVLNKPTPVVIQKKTEIKLNSPIDETIWKKLLEDIREKNVSIEALLRAASPLNFDGKNLELGVYYQFHKDRLEDVKNNKILEDICKVSLGLDNLKVNFRLIEKPISEKKVEVVKSIEPLTTNVDKDIIDVAEAIFGK